MTVSLPVPLPLPVPVYVFVYLYVRLRRQLHLCRAASSPAIDSNSTAERRVLVARVTGVEGGKIHTQTTPAAQKPATKEFCDDAMRQLLSGRTCADETVDDGRYSEADEGQCAGPEEPRADSGSHWSQIKEEGWGGEGECRMCRRCSGTGTEESGHVNGEGGKWHEEETIVETKLRQAMVRLEQYERTEALLRNHLQQVR